MSRAAAPALRGPIGVRGPATGPRVNLADVDTSLTRHDLFVKIVNANDPDQVSRQVTLETLRYVLANKEVLAKMGVHVEVQKISNGNLTNPRLIEALKRRGIVRLPAVSTGRGIYLGLKDIQAMYDRNIREFASMARRGESEVVGAEPDDRWSLEEFYRDEMSFQRAEEDAEEAGIGESDDMMDAYRGMVERREKSESKRRRGPGRAPAPEIDDAERAPRADNVREEIRAPVTSPAPRIPQHHDPENDEINETIAKLARGVDDDLRTRAMQSADEDGESDIQDDVMERYYWSNQDAST